MKPAWQAEARKRLKDLGLSEHELAAQIRCAQSTLHQTLNNPEARHSSLLPAIHAAFGWGPPPDPTGASPLPSSDAIEMAHMFDRLSDEMKLKLLEDAKFYLRIGKLQPEKRTEKNRPDEKK